MNDPEPSGSDPLFAPLMVQVVTAFGPTRVVLAWVPPTRVLMLLIPSVPVDIAVPRFTVTGVV